MRLFMKIKILSYINISAMFDQVFCPTFSVETCGLSLVIYFYLNIAFKINGQHKFQT